MDRLEIDLARENLEIASLYRRSVAYMVDLLLLIVLTNLMLTSSQKISINNAVSGLHLAMKSSREASDVVVNGGAAAISPIDEIGSESYGDSTKWLVPGTDDITSIYGVIVWFVVVMCVVEVIYHSVFVYMYGASLGKMLLRIRVVNRFDFDKPSVKDSICRSATRCVLGQLFYITFVFALFDKWSRTIHDKWCNTIVVNS